MGQYFAQVTQNREGVRVWHCQIKTPEGVNENSDDYFRDYYIGIKLMEHSWLHNKFMDSMCNYIYKNPTKIAWVGDYADNFKWEYPDGKPSPKVLHNMAWEGKAQEELPYSKFDYAGKFLVNHTHKVGLSFDEYIKSSTDKDDWCIHPLSLLTACGNGEGGGDFDEDYVGASDVGLWCYDEISIEDELPRGYELADFCFKEEYA